MYRPNMNQKLIHQIRRRRRVTRARQLAQLDRRQFLQATALTTAMAFATGCQMLPTEQSEAVQVAGMPKAIPGGTDMGDPMPFLHFYLPSRVIAPEGAPTIADRNADPSTVYDFSGDIGVFEPFGGTGTDGDGNTLYWAADVRFMKGDYVGENGVMGQSAFAFL